MKLLKQWTEAKDTAAALLNALVLKQSKPLNLKLRQVLTVTLQPVTYALSMR